MRNDANGSLRWVSVLHSPRRPFPSRVHTSTPSEDCGPPTRYHRSKGRLLRRVERWITANHSFVSSIGTIIDLRVDIFLRIPNVSHSLHLHMCAVRAELCVGMWMGYSRDHTCLSHGIVTVTMSWTALERLAYLEFEIPCELMLG